MACAMGYTISPVARAEFIDELLTQDTSLLTSDSGHRTDFHCTVNVRVVECESVPEVPVTVIV